jgi:hypothetical protein
LERKEGRGVKRGEGRGHVDHFNVVEVVYVHNNYFRGISRPLVNRVPYYLHRSRGHCLKAKSSGVLLKGHMITAARLHLSVPNQAIYAF